MGMLMAFPWHFDQRSYALGASKDLRGLVMHCSLSLSLASTAAPYTRPGPSAPSCHQHRPPSVHLRRPEPTRVPGNGCAALSTSPFSRLSATRSTPSCTPPR